jgi:esterase/lipase superfamily enzyme
MAKVSIPHDHRMGMLEQPRWFHFEFRENPALHVVLLEVRPCERAVFTKELQDFLCRAKEPEALVFIHGYNVSFVDAARRTAQIAYDLNFHGAPILYSWPSRAKPLAYTVDETNVLWTVPNYQEFMRLVRTEIGVRRVSVIAHSMGNRALVDLLRLAAAAPVVNGAEISNIVFAAPDVDADSFRQFALDFHNHARRLTLYASQNDRALWASKRVHGYARAGEAGDNIVLVDSIDTIDASALDTSLLGHSYYGESRSILSDVYSLLKHGTPPDERHGLRPRSVSTSRYWVFQP